MENKKRESMMMPTLSNEKEIGVALFQSVKQSTQVAHAEVTVNHQAFPTIRTLINRNGEKSVMICLLMLIEDCLASLNIQQPNKEQVKEIARELINDHPALKMEDYRIFFMNIKKGVYGSDYNRFDISTVYRMMAIFLEQRTTLFEQELQNRKHQQQKLISISDKAMETIYDVALREASSERIKQAEEKRLRKQAPEQWHKDFNKWKQGKSQDEVEDYLLKYPLNDEYIRHYVKTNLR